MRLIELLQLNSILNRHLTCPPLPFSPFLSLFLQSPPQSSVKHFLSSHLISSSFLSYSHTPSPSSPFPSHHVHFSPVPITEGCCGYLFLWVFSVSSFIDGLMGRHVDQFSFFNRLLTLSHGALGQVEAVHGVVSVHFCYSTPHTHWHRH